ncbi:MAG TPA: FAD-dependent tricarballylate dehydrogenase TcuA [Candidatus Binatia bacterium]|nr:FAD-dependent tricarballylate dehydrogenase TcuA [Candidatus Binatia bacterium]
MRSETIPVTVVGGGSAAFEAAVAAREAGAPQVVMLEKAPEPEFGGNARYSHTGFRWVFSGAGEIRRFLPDLDDATFEKLHLPAYSADMFHADLQRVTRGRIDKKLAEVLVQQSNAAIHWMRELGIRWEIDSHVVIEGRYYFEPGLVIHPVGGITGGLGQLGQWREIATRMGVEIRYESRVRALVGNDRRIQGVVVSDPHEEYEIRSGSIILCAGGYQANAEMRARYLGPNADLMKVRGSRHDTGEVLIMALALGAKAAGHWQGAHATPIDSTYPDVEIGSKANRYGYPYGITVNSLGQRFFDEGEARHSYTYAKTGWAVLGQPGAVAYQIYDQKTIPLLADRYQTATPINAGTIEELAQKIGIEPAVLNHTIREFNNAVRKDVAFDPTKLDGKCTEGITPKKSNWASPIDTPPYRAYSVTGGITFTFGGLQINESAQVLNTSGNPIRGLYASGDIVGLFFHNYPSCTGQTRNVVFSRLAGRHAAAQGL